MVNKEDFNKNLVQVLSQQGGKRRFINSLNQLMYNNHNVSAGEVRIIINQITKDIEQVTVEQLYWLSQSIEIILDMSNLLQHFTLHEKTAYENSKKHLETKEKYPIIFKDVKQLNSDQWITTIDADKLYELYKEQIINYNKNTQRPSIRKEKDGIVEYKISLNKASMNEIHDLMKQNLFISNTITLNLNIDNPEIDFEYKNGDLIIYSGVLDIIDGFHRYQALIKNKMEDENFHYNMSLNIMNFDEAKSCQFIAQEDKRNKIDKRVTRTMDSTNPINTIIQRLNDDSRCYLYGQIGRTETSKINSSWLFESIDACYKIKTRNDSIELIKYLKNIFNSIIEDEFMEYTFLDIAIIIRGSVLYKGTNDYIEKIEHLLLQKTNITKDKYRLHKMNKVLINEIDKLKE